MMTTVSSETLLPLCPNTASRIPKGRNLHIRSNGNVISHTVTLVWSCGSQNGLNIPPGVTRNF